MNDLPRLRWIKEVDRYAAYPMGPDHPDRWAAIRLGNVGLDTNFTPHQRRESWAWTIRWNGWFAQSGTADSKQAAADGATQAWWRAVARPLPRPVDLEIDMIVARLLVMPPPNSLFMEDMDFLQRLNRAVFSLYQVEINNETTPQPVKELLARLSAELYRRRLAGETGGSQKNRWSVT